MHRIKEHVDCNNVTNVMHDKQRDGLLVITSLRARVGKKGVKTQVWRHKNSPCNGWRVNIPGEISDISHQHAMDYWIKMDGQPGWNIYVAVFPLVNNDKKKKKEKKRKEKERKKKDIWLSPVEKLNSRINNREVPSVLVLFIDLSSISKVRQ